MSSGESVILAPAGYDVDADVGSDMERPWRLIEGLSRRGLHVTVVARRVARPADLGSTVTIRLLPGKMPATPIGRLLDRVTLYRYARTVALAELRQHRVLAVHHVSPCGPSSPTLLPRLPVPFVYGPMPNVAHVGSPEGWALWLGFRKAGASQQLLGKALSRTAAPIASALWRRTISMADAVTVEAAAIAPPERQDATVIPMGLDLSLFFPTGAASRPGRIVAVGALLPRKGFDVLIEAVARVRHDISSVHVVIAGEGPEREPLQRLASRLDLESAITFLGRLPRQELPELYRSACVFCHPARSESFPFVVIEAMASGLPVLASNFGALPEMIGPAGLIHPVGDIDVLAEHLRIMLTDPVRRQELATAARDRATRVYSVDSMCDSYLRLYTELASRRARPVGATSAPAGAKRAGVDASIRGN